MYINTVKQLGISESTNSKKEQGRVVSSRPLSSIERQLFKTHYDGYQPRMPRQLATAIKRYINSKPKHERKRPDFVGEIRRKILCLHEYNLQVAEVKRKYPRSQYFDGLLVQYIKLECDLFYNTHEIITEDVEKASRQRLLRFLKVILHDSYHNSDSTVRETNNLCDKTLLKLFATVRVDLDGENKFVDNIIVKMVEKLNLLEDINKLKGRHVEMLKDPEARKIRKNLSTSDYESDTDTNSDDDAKTSSFNGHFLSKPLNYKANSVPDKRFGISNIFQLPCSNDTIKNTSTLCENFSGSSHISTANSTKLTTIGKNCDVMDHEPSFNNVLENEKVHRKELREDKEKLNHPAISKQNHSFQNLNTFNNVRSDCIGIDYGRKKNNAFSGIGKTSAKILNQPVLDHSNDVIIIDDDDENCENTVYNNHQSNSDNKLNTTFLQPVQIKLEENENSLPKFSLEKSNHLNFLGITKPPTGDSAEFNGFRNSFGGSGQIVDNVDIVISDSEDECHKDILTVSSTTDNTVKLSLEEKEVYLQKFPKQIQSALNKIKNEQLHVFSNSENTFCENEISPESNFSSIVSCDTHNTTSNLTVAHKSSEEILKNADETEITYLSESASRQKTTDKFSESQQEVNKNGTEMSKTIMVKDINYFSRAIETAKSHFLPTNFQINQVTSNSTVCQRENIVALSYSNVDESGIAKAQKSEESIVVPHLSNLEHNLEKCITEDATTSKELKKFGDKQYKYQRKTINTFNLKNDIAETQVNKMISIEPVSSEQSYVDKIDKKITDEVLKEQTLEPTTNWFQGGLKPEISNSFIENLEIAKKAKQSDLDESEDVLAAIEGLINGVLEKERSFLLTEEPKSLIHRKCMTHDSNDTHFVDEDSQNEQNIVPSSTLSNQNSDFTNVVKVSVNKERVSSNSVENLNLFNAQNDETHFAGENSQNEENIIPPSGKSNQNSDFTEIVSDVEQVSANIELVTSNSFENFNLFNVQANETHSIDEDNQNEQNMVPPSDKSNQNSNFTEIVSDVVQISANEELVSSNSSENLNLFNVQTEIPIKTTDLSNVFERGESLVALENFPNGADKLRASLRSLMGDTKENTYPDYTFDKRLSPGSSALDVPLENEARDAYVDDELLSIRMTTFPPDTSNEVTISSLVSEDINTDIHLDNATAEYSSLTETPKTLLEASSDREVSLQKKIYSGRNEDKCYSLEVEDNHVADDKSLLEVSRNSEVSFREITTDLDANNEEYYTLEELQASSEENNEMTNDIVTCPEPVLEISCNSEATLRENPNLDENAEEWCNIEYENEENNLIIGQKLSVEGSSKDEAKLQQNTNLDANTEDYALEYNPEESNVDTSQKFCFEVLTTREASLQKKSYANANEEECIVEAPQIYLEENNEDNAIIGQNLTATELEQNKYLENNTEQNTENLVEGELNLFLTSSEQNCIDTPVTQMEEYETVVGCSNMSLNEGVLHNEIVTSSVPDAPEPGQRLENLRVENFNKNEDFMDKVRGATITTSKKNEMITVTGQEQVHNLSLSMKESSNFTCDIALDLSNKEEIDENNTECLTYFKKRRSCDKIIHNALINNSTFCNDDSKVKNITEDLECFNQNEVLQNNISSIQIEKRKTDDNSSRSLNEISSEGADLEKKILTPSITSSSSQKKETTGLSIAYLQDDKEREEVICDTETDTLQVCDSGSTTAKSLDIVDKDLPKDVRECSVILERSRNVDKTTNPINDDVEIYKRLNSDSISRANESVQNVSEHILNLLSLKDKTKCSEILEKKNSTFLHKTTTNIKDESTDLIVKDTASTPNDCLNSLNASKMSKNAEITECSVILDRNIVNHAFKSKSIDVSISDDSKGLDDNVFATLQDGHGEDNYDDNVTCPNNVANSDDKVPTCSVSLEKAESVDCHIATEKEALTNAHLKNKDITECSVILQRDDSTLDEKNRDCAVLDNQDKPEDENFPKSKSNINPKNVTIPVCDLLYYNSSAVNSTLDETEYVEPAIEKKTNLDMLATLAVKRQDKDKSFSDENCTKMETDISRITRRSFSKRKLDFGNVGQPHDFISMESPILTPRTNNVYDQQKAVEQNTTSEESNDSCENSLYIDLNEKTAIEASSIFDEETKWDMLEFITSGKNTSSGEGSSQESLQGKSITEFAASQMLIYEKKAEPEHNIDASASKQNLNVSKEGKTNSKSRVKKTDHSIQNILSKTSPETNSKKGDTLSENSEARSTSSGTADKKSDIEFSEIENKTLIPNQIEDPSSSYIPSTDESSLKLSNITDKEPEDWIINSSGASSNEKIFRTKAEVKSYENKLQKGSPNRTLPISTRTRLRLKSSEEGKKGRFEETNLKDGEKRENSAFLSAESIKSSLVTDTEEEENSPKTPNNSQIEKFTINTKDSTLDVSSDVERSIQETNDCISAYDIILNCENEESISSTGKSNVCSNKSPEKSEVALRGNEAISTNRNQILNTIKNRHKKESTVVKDDKINIGKNKLKRSDQAKEISLEKTIKKMKESIAEFEIPKNDTNLLKDNKIQTDDTSIKEIDEVKKGSRNNKRSKSSSGTSSKQDSKEKNSNEANLSKSKSLTLRERKCSNPQNSGVNSLSTPNNDAEGAGRRRSKSRSIDNRNEHTKTQNRKRLSSICKNSTDDLHLAKKQKTLESKCSTVNPIDKGKNFENEKTISNLEINLSNSPAKEAHNKKGSGHKKHGKINKIGEHSTKETKVAKNAKPIKETRRLSAQLTETTPNKGSKTIINKDNKPNNKGKTKERNDKLRNCSSEIEDSLIDISKSDKSTSSREKRKYESKNKTSVIHNKKSKKFNEINSNSKNTEEKKKTEIQSHIEQSRPSKSNQSGISDAKHIKDIKHLTIERKSTDLAKEQTFVGSSNKKNKGSATSQATHVHSKEKKYFADIPKKRKYSFPDDNNCVDNYQNVKIPKVDELNKEVTSKEENKLQGVTNSIDFKSTVSSLAEQTLDVTLKTMNQDSKTDLYLDKIVSEANDAINEIPMPTLKIVEANETISYDEVDTKNTASDVTDSTSNIDIEIGSAFENDVIDNIPNVNEKDNLVMTIDDTANTLVFPAHEAIAVDTLTDATMQADGRIIVSQSTCEPVSTVSLLKDEDLAVKRPTSLAEGHCCVTELTVTDTNNYESTLESKVNLKNIADCDTTITSAVNASDKKTDDKTPSDVIGDEINDLVNPATNRLEQAEPEIANTAKEFIENISANEDSGLPKTIIADIPSTEATSHEIIQSGGFINETIANVNKKADLSKSSEDGDLLKTFVSDILIVESTSRDIIQTDELSNETITELNKITDLPKSPESGAITEDTDLLKTVVPEIPIVESTLGEIIQTDGSTNETINEVNKIPDLLKGPESGIAEDIDLSKTTVSDISVVASGLSEIIQTDEFTNETITDVNKMVEVLKSPEGGIIEDTDLLKTTVSDSPIVESTLGEIIQRDDLTRETINDVNKMTDLLKRPESGVVEDTDLLKGAVANIPTVESALTEIIQTDELTNETATDVEKMADLLKSSEGGMAEDTDLLKTVVSDIPVVESTLAEIIETDEITHEGTIHVNEMADSLKKPEGGMAKDTDLLKTAIADILTVESTLCEIIQTEEITNETTTDVNKMAELLNPENDVAKNTELKTVDADVPMVELTLVQIIDTDELTNKTTTDDNKIDDSLKNPEDGVAKDRGLPKTAVVNIPAVESSSAEIIETDEFTKETTTDVDKKADLLAKGDMLEDLDLLKTATADIPPVKTRLPEISQTTQFTKEVIYNVNKIADLLKISPEDTDLLKTTVADFTTIESTSVEIIQTDKLTNETTTDASKMVDLLKHSEGGMAEKSTEGEVTNSNETTNEPSNEVIDEDLGNLVKTHEDEIVLKPVMSETINADKITEEVTNDIIEAEVPALIKNIHDDRVLEETVTETVNIDETTYELRNISENVGLFKTTNQNSTDESTSTKGFNIVETTNDNMPRKITDSLEDTVIDLVDTAKVENISTPNIRSSSKLEVNLTSDPSIAKIPVCSKLSTNNFVTVSTFREDEIPNATKPVLGNQFEDVQSKNNQFQIFPPVAANETSVVVNSIPDIPPPVKLLLQGSDISEISSEKSILADNVYSTASANLNIHVLAATVDSTIKHFTVEDRNLSVTSMTSASASMRCRSNIAEPSTSTGCSSNQEYTYNEDTDSVNQNNLNSSELFNGLDDISPRKLPLASNQTLDLIASQPISFEMADNSQARKQNQLSSKFVTGVTKLRCYLEKESYDHNYTTPGDPLLGGTREEKFNPFASEFSYSNSVDFQMNEDVPSYIEDDSTLVDSNELFSCKGEKSDFEPIIDDSSEKDTENVENSIEDRPESNDIVYVDTSDNSKSLGIEEAINKLLFLSADVMSESSTYATLNDINNMNIIEGGNDSQIMADKEISNDILHEEEISYGPINKYASFLPSEEKKVLVEQIEQCPIIPFEPINKDYLIESNSQSPEEVEENVVKPNIKKHKSRPFKITITKPKEKPKDELEGFIAKKATRPVLAIKKSRTVNDVNENKNSKDSLLKEGRIRVKTDLIKPKQIDDPISNLDYIREDQQSIASEITLPFSRPSPEKVSKANKPQKNVEPSSKPDDSMTLAAKYNDKLDKDIKFLKCLPNISKILKGEESEIQNPAHIETNKKRKVSFDGVKNVEKHVDHAEKRQKKTDSVEKTKNTHNVSQLSNFDKVKESGITNKFFNQKMNEKNKDAHIEKLQNVSHRMYAQPTTIAASLNRETLLPENVRNLKNRVSSITTPENLPTRGYSTFTDSRESYKHRTRHPSSDAVRDSKIHSYYRGKRIPYYDQNHKRNQRENSTTADLERRYDKRAFPHNNHKPDTSSSRHMRIREEKRGSEQERAHQSSYKGSAGRTQQDDYQWLKKFNQSDFWNQRDDLFKPAEPKNEASTARK